MNPAMINKAERLKEILDIFNLSAHRIGRLTHRSNGVILNYTLGKQEIPDEFNERLQEAIPELNLKWFSSGVGKMLSGKKITKGNERKYSLKKGVSQEMVFRIISIREELGLNKASLSVELGLGNDIQFNIEALRQNPSIEYLKLLTEKLYVNSNFILTGLGERFLKKVDVKVNLVGRLQDQHDKHMAECKIRLKEMEELRKEKDFFKELLEKR